MAAFTLTVPPPVEVPGALKDSVRPFGSVNATLPATTPLFGLGAPTVASPATGVPVAEKLTGTVTV